MSCNLQLPSANIFTDIFLNIWADVSTSQNDQKLNVLIETEKGQKAGLGGVVTANALD